jgi:hypothetical protein
VKALSVAVLALLLAGCDGEKAHRSNTGRGWVRNIWVINRFNVTFEREDGMTFTYAFGNPPAVWVGMHATIDYSYEPNSVVPCSYTAGSVQRWP